MRIGVLSRSHFQTASVFVHRPSYPLYVCDTLTTILMFLPRWKLAERAALPILICSLTF